MIYIDNETGKMVNIHAPYKGRSRLDSDDVRAAVGVVGIEEDPLPADYDPQLYSRREDWEATQRPYIIYERLPDDQVAQIILQRYERALDAHLDAVAQNHRYNDRFTFAIRAGYAGPYQAEGIAFAAWMDSCNSTAYALMEEVAAGTRPMPASKEEFLSIFQPFVWPVPAEPAPEAPSEG